MFKKTAIAFLVLGSASVMADEQRVAVEGDEISRIEVEQGTVPSTYETTYPMAEREKIATSSVKTRFNPDLSSKPDHYFKLGVISPVGLDSNFDTEHESSPGIDLTVGTSHEGVDAAIRVSRNSLSYGGMSWIGHFDASMMYRLVDEDAYRIRLGGGFDTHAVGGSNFYAERKGAGRNLDRMYASGVYVGTDITAAVSPSFSIATSVKYHVDLDDYAISTNDRLDMVDMYDDVTVGINLTYQALDNVAFAFDSTIIGSDVQKTGSLSMIIGF